MTLGPDAPAGCPDCSTLGVGGRYCVEHADSHVLQGMIWVDQMSHRVLREAVHVLKYSGVQELGSVLGGLLSRRLQNYPQLAEAVIVPIPLHRRRQQERGFNQAELIAAELSGYKKERLLVRYRSSLPQASLGREERWLNAQAVYGVPVSSRERLVGRVVLLVDDVSTTGATFEAAAAVLKRAGAKEVWGAIIAKG